MDKNITFTVDSDVYEKFNIALENCLTKQQMPVSVGILLKLLETHQKYTLQRQQSKPIRTKIFTEKHCSVFRCGR